METSTQHLSDYLAILRRRKLQVLIPAVVICAASVALAFGIPPTYRSTATILIEQQEIPEDLVPTTVTGYANQRIKVISYRIMTRDKLLRIVEKLNLNPEERQAGKTDQIIARMRANTALETVGGPGRGRGGSTTIAFELSFDADTPEVAQAVVDELVALYLDENRKIRTQKAEVTSGFLADEERRLANYVARLEAKLARHKEKNAGQLPDLMKLNLQLMERTERELEATERQLYNLEERKMYLDSQLAQLEPNIGTSRAVRLRELQTEYVSALALYAPDHPDLVRMGREIELLEEQVGDTDEAGEITKQLIQLRIQLARVREKYAESHPDVIRLKGSVATLEEALRNAPTSTQTAVLLKPDNPSYISIQNQLDAVKLNLQAAQQKRRRAKARSAEYERRIIETPRVEQAGLALQREYDNAANKHREFKQKLMQAELALQLEKAQKGKRYAVLEPPRLSREPVAPNRRAILLLGLVLAVGGGIGYASLAEYMDRTVRGPRNIQAVIGAPPLAVIPYLEAQKDPYQHHKKSA